MMFMRIIKSVVKESIGIWMLVSMVAGLAGCAGLRASNDDMAALLALAREGNVQGRLKVRISADAEVGMREGFYLASPGSSAEADFTIKFQDNDSAMGD